MEIPIGMRLSVLMKTPLSPLFSKGYSSLRNLMIPSSLTVLFYHRVGPLPNDWSLPGVDVAQFERQIEHLASNYRILGAKELYDSLQGGSAFPKRSALVTFDDGYKDNYLNAYPILRKRRIPAIIFLTTGSIENRELLWWDVLGYAASKIRADTKREEIVVDVEGEATFRLDEITPLIERLKDVPDSVRRRAIARLMDDHSIDIPSELVEENLLTWQEVKEMAEGGIHFGAHTVDHPILTRMPLEEAKEQISGSKDRIEKRIGQEVFSFAYPNGYPRDYNTDVSNYLRRTGFKAAFTTRPIINPAGADPMTIGRIGASNDARRLDLLLSGFTGDIGKIRSQHSG